MYIHTHAHPIEGEIVGKSSSAPIGSTSSGSRPANGEDPWETWNRLRTLCEHNAAIGVALGGWVVGR